MEAWPAEGRFADIFIKKAPVLRLYTEYLNNYERQVPTVFSFVKSLYHNLTDGALTCRFYCSRNWRRSQRLCSSSKDVRLR